MRPPVLRSGLLVFLALIASGITFFHVQGYHLSFSEREDGFDAPLNEEPALPPFLDPYAHWQRPDGPLRVGLQAGHWQAAEAPEELAKLRVNTGASAGGVDEWEANLAIAQATKRLLEAEGIVVDLLPATIPPEYWADAFVAIHADGNQDPSVSGYKIAAPYRDRSGKAAILATLMDETYKTATDLPFDPNITRNMRGYYAFNWRKYEHSIHPMTPAVIVETGFLTNSKDRALIARRPETAAQGIAEAVIRFLKQTAPSEKSA